MGALERGLASAKEVTDRQLAEAAAEADAVRSQVAQLRADGTINPLDSQQAIMKLQVSPSLPHCGVACMMCCNCCF